MSDTNSDNSWALYRYSPSEVAAIVFVILFALASVLHAYNTIQTKTWYLLPLVIGALFEVVGYVGRAVSATETPNWTLGPYIVQSLLLLLAPILFSASIYMELGRIILVTDGESYTIVKRKWLTKLFVTGDILCFLTQAAGGGIMAEGSTHFNTGQSIIIGGLCLQLFFFGCFVAIAALFHWRISRSPTRCSVDLDIKWQKHQVALYGTSIFIVIRNTYRVIEYILGNDGYLLQNEWSVYVFDACLMLGVLLWFLVVHPSEINAMLRGGRFAKWRGFKIIYLTRRDPIGGASKAEKVEMTSLDRLAIPV